MAYSGVTISDLDVNKPDGSTEYVNCLDNAIRELKRAIKTDQNERVTSIDTDLDALVQAISQKELILDLRSVDLTSNIDMNVQSQWFDILNLVLPAGKWIVYGQWSTSGGSSRVFQLRLTDKSTHYSSVHGPWWPYMYPSRIVSGMVKGYLDLATQKTVYLQAYAFETVTSPFHVTVLGSNKYTQLVAVRLNA